VDLQGSKWRIGDIAPRHLSPGDSVTLAYRPDKTLEDSLPGVLPVPHRDFFRALESGDGRVLVNDARVELSVETVREYQAFCTVIKGDHLEPRKGLTIPGSKFRTEGLQERDREVVEQSQAYSNVSFALSYVRDSVEMERFRRDIGGRNQLIAKIERQNAIDDANAIAAVSDEVWLCRGDLGAELGLRQMAQAVYEFSRILPELEAPAILAGQVLEHTTRHPEPTRSELCHLYDILKAGFQGIVLSDETAIGLHPLESCRAAALFLTK
jgi:pyruvate kinase